MQLHQCCLLASYQDTDDWTRAAWRRIKALLRVFLYIKAGEEVGTHPEDNMSHGRPWQEA